MDTFKAVFVWKHGLLDRIGSKVLDYLRMEMGE